MWHKARAQPSQGVAGRLHHLGRPAMCWRISKNRFVYVSNRGSAQGIQCPKAVQGGNLAAWPSCMADRPDKWASQATESVKKVRFSPQGASKFNLCRVERDARFCGPEDFLACRESSE
jgi:hypothetical protein